MASGNDHDISQLNSLIEATLDSAKGYQDAAEEAKASRFSTLFRQRAALVCAAVSLLPGSLAAQSLNLRDLLTNFFREGITLADPPAGSPFPSHAHHFVGDASLVPLEQLNSELAAQLSTFPLASSAGGFTYQLDPSLGVLTRATDSFGPIYADRADSIGKGKFAIGLNFSPGSLPLSLW